MPRYKIKWFKDQKDIAFHLDDFGKTANVIFITGLFGSGKTTTAKQLAKNYNATVIHQDFMSFFESYPTKECERFTGLFQETYPETKEWYQKKLWRNDEFVSERVREEYRKKFIQFIIDYTKSHKDEKFIFEGAAFYFYPWLMDQMAKCPLIIKRTSILRSLKNMTKRDRNQTSFSARFKVFWRYRCHWIIYSKKLNKQIIKCVKLYPNDISFIETKIDDEFIK